MIKIPIVIWIGIIICGPLSAQDNLLKNEVSIVHKKERLKNIIEKLSEDYQLLFSYSELNLSHRKTIDYKGTLQGGLDQLLKPERIAYKVIGNQIVLKYERIKGEGILGKVVDENTKTPLIGANVLILNASPAIGTSTDLNGVFEIKGLEIGRYDLGINYLGYEPRIVAQVLVSSGSGVQLNVELQESIYGLEEAVVVAEIDPAEPINEMAGNSTRSFTVEETQRYAASLSDPARMVQSFAGVSGGGDDISNIIIIRGNSSRNLSWRLEGVEIPSPNHFGDLGGGTGAVSMLSSRTLTNSDFYTGAFPAEFGNALSGVFDLKLRNGNNSKRQHSLAIGNLGIEASTEGYWKKGSAGSYLANYRYSTTGLIEEFLPALIGQKNTFQDLSFKAKIPTKSKGYFSIFGIGGQSLNQETQEVDANPWIPGPTLYQYREEQITGTVGLTHNYILNDNAYLKSAIVGTFYDYDDLTVLESKENLYDPASIDDSDFTTYELTGAINYHRKINSKSYFHTGLSLNYERFIYDFSTAASDTSFFTFFDSNGSAGLLQYFIQWKYRFAENWEIISGLNYTHFFLNNTIGLDPRVSLSWKFKPKHKLGLSLGLYSKPEHSSTYLIESPLESQAPQRVNKDLAMMRAFHAVSSYDVKFWDNWRFKTEAYYQYLFNIPVAADPEVPFSIINTFNVFDIISESYQERNQSFALVSEGIGINYGLEFTLEKFFDRQYYGLFTLSLFDSKYRALDQRIYPTLFAQNVLFNILGGKEWQIGKGDSNILGLNGKFTYNGGTRYTPIDLEATKRTGEIVAIPNSIFSEKLNPYYRFDLGISYKINTPKITHTFRLDVQNVTNRRNIASKFYDNNLQIIREQKQNGLIPFMIYRIEFTSGE